MTHLRMSDQMEVPALAPGTLQLCNTCCGIEKLIPLELPYKEDDAVPHHPNLVALIDSAKHCPLCFHILWNIIFVYGHDSGSTIYCRGDPQKGIDFAISGGVFTPSESPGALTRFTKNGAAEIDLSGKLEPDFSSRNTIHPVHLVCSICDCSIRR